MQSLSQDLGKAMGSDTAANNTQGTKLAAADASQSVQNASRPAANQPLRPTPISDVAATLLSEIATSDIAKLSQILDPAPNQVKTKVLDSLLHLAVQEVAKGNPERAVGYLANYATRDPRRAETMPLEPGLQPLRDKIDSMVNRMTFVAKTSAEEGLSRAEQTASLTAGKLPEWDTNAEVLLKVAHRFFEAGGFANYSRTTEIARVVTDASTVGNSAAHAMAASASASSVQMMPGIPVAGDIIPGVNVPYWASPEFPMDRPTEGRVIRRASAGSMQEQGTLRQNLRDLRAISKAAVHQLWRRAPLLLFLLVWFSAGLMGGIIFSIGSRFWPESPLVALGSLGFELWGIGFLALVGFGFYMRVRDKAIA
jgi:hypothetical protein